MEQKMDLKCYEIHLSPPKHTEPKNTCDYLFFFFNLSKFILEIQIKYLLAFIWTH